MEKKASAEKAIRVQTLLAMEEPKTGLWPTSNFGRNSQTDS